MIITLDCMTTLERGWGMLEERIVAFPPRGSDHGGIEKATPDQARQDEVGDLGTGV